ncbi:hypothetical protein D3C73_1013450 [compost metagenome]
MAARFSSWIGLRPLYLPAFCALSIPSRCRSSIISRSNWAIPPNTVRISLPVGVLVSSPRLRILTSTFFNSNRCSVCSRSVIERASRSSLVTTKVSPTRANSMAASNWRRWATDDTCSLNIFSQPHCSNSRNWASKPASCSIVEVRA